MKSRIIGLICQFSILAGCLSFAQAAARPRTHFTPAIAAQIVETARRYDLDPLLILEVMRQESQFKIYSTSYKNGRPCAHGLMQLTPPTAARFGVDNPYDPADAIEAGCRYLSWLMNRYAGRLDLVLASYNAGENAVDRFGGAVPPFRETQNYVRIILSNFQKARLSMRHSKALICDSPQRPARKFESVRRDLQKVFSFPSVR